MSGIETNLKNPKPQKMVSRPRSARDLHHCTAGCHFLNKISRKKREARKDEQVGEMTHT